MNSPYRILVHGGTDNFLSESPRKQVVELALASAHAILARGGHSLDAVEKVVEIFEDSGVFNAGKGSATNCHSIVEQDACIMDGATLAASSVGALQRIKNPIRVARVLLEQKKAVFLVGEGARQFALDHKLATTDNSYYIPSICSQEPENHFGTVGAVALDLNGNLAAATSSGGMQNKPAGRLGDSPIPGAGTYADNDSCAVSATGMGEMFIRATVAFRVSSIMALTHVPLKQAAKIALEKVAQLGGVGGLIAMDKMGEITVQGNAFLEAAYMDEKKQIRFIKA